MNNSVQKLSDSEIKELIATHLGRDYDINSPKGKALSKVIANIGFISDAASFAELIRIDNSFFQ